MKANYVLEVRVHTYQNSDHKEVDGYCCESYAWVWCSDHCDNIFHFCLRPTGTTRDDNSGNCPLGRYNTVSDVPGGDDISFGSSNIAPGVPNPLTFTGSSAWPVSIARIDGILSIIVTCICAGSSSAVHKSHRL